MDEIIEKLKLVEKLFNYYFIEGHPIDIVEVEQNSIRLSDLESAVWYGRVSEKNRVNPY